MNAAPEKDLGKFLGLDDATVSEQVLPIISSHKTPKALHAYLRDLIGSSPEAMSLTERFVHLHFPKEEESASRRDAKPIRLTPSTLKSALAEADQRAKPRHLEPTPEMKALDAELTMLSTEPSSENAFSYAPTQRYMCLCQGQQHELAKWAPLCVACGLVLCNALRPVPIAPTSICPSCQTSPIVSTKDRMRLLSEMAGLREHLAQEQAEQESRRHAEWTAQRLSGQLPEQAFPALNERPSSLARPTPTMQGKVPRSRTLHLDLKTHKVTVSKSRPKSSASASETSSTHTSKRNEGHSEDMPSTAEDGSPLIYNFDDDGFRFRFGNALSHQAIKSFGRHWSDVPASSITCTYMPSNTRDMPLPTFETEELTEVPELDSLLQRRPPGSASDSRHRNRQSATAEALSRSQGRKTGKPGRRRRPGK